MLPCFGGNFNKRKETLIKEWQILKHMKMGKARTYIGIGYNWDLEPEEENYDDKKLH